MSALCGAHLVRLERRAALLAGRSADAGGEPHDPARAAVLRGVARKVDDALERGAPLALTPAERTALVTEAAELTSRAAKELGRAGPRELRRAEEWVATARALREVAEATRAAS